MQPPLIRTLLCLLASFGPLLAQTPAYDPDWYRPEQTHIKLHVTEDGIHRVDAQDLAAAGVQIGSVDPSSLRLIENGVEIPIWYEGSGVQVSPTDYFLFVGRRNTGESELWAYNYEAGLRSSGYRSLYTDTTTYFLTWGIQPGIRYQRESNSAVTGPVLDKVRVQEHLETDEIYFFGAPESSGNPAYTAGEGYYMRILSHGGPILRASFVLGLSDITRSDEDSIRVDVRLQGGTRSPHLGFVDLRYLDESTNTQVEVAFDSVAWLNYGAASMTANLAQRLIPGNGQSLRVRVGSDNTVGAAPNNVYIDYLTYNYNRTLNPGSGPFRFTSTFSGPRTFRLSGTADSQVIVLMPQTRSRFDVSGNGTFGAATAIGQEYWLSTEATLKRPVVVNDRPSNLADPSLEADYVVISAPALLASAEEMAAYRASLAGGSYLTMVVDVNDVYDQFDYGRATPIAVRRFIDGMRSWRRPPRFVTIWGDALYPDARRPRFNWEVVSFGNASSDGWFAMQSAGDLGDYTESLAIGRVTVRENDAGSRFVEKIAGYEARPPPDWQKRAIMMSGGASVGEQRSLTSHTRRWGEDMIDAPFGADVTFFHKTSTAALDPTFLDSVDAAINEGSGWLAFFGHSAADTWEIVTEPPPLFENSQRLPIVVSLGCFTGAFSRGDGSEFDQPPFAELLVTESANGAIAHYGGSTSSTISAGRQIADPLYELVFNAGLRTLGEVMIESKKLYLERNPVSNRAETVMQYNLIGDPATRMALPAKPNFHIEPRSITVAPAGPVAGIDSTVTVTIDVENWGLIPDDSLTVDLFRVAPDGATSRSKTRIPAFPLRQEVSFDWPIVETEVGRNRLVVTVDADSEYDEVSEEDNVVEVPQLVFASGVVQLFPPNLGLVTSRRPGLRFGKASAAEERLAVRAELDTTLTFDSAAIIRESVEAAALSGWTPPELFDQTTYEWRLAVETDDEPEWRSRAFTVDETLPRNGFLQKDRLFEQNEHGPTLVFENGSWQMLDFDVDIRVRSAQFMAPAPNTIIVGGFEHETLQIGFSVVIVSVEGLFKTGDSFVPYPNLVGADEASERERLRTFLASAENNEYVFINSRFIRVADGVVDLPDETADIFRELGSTQIDSVDLRDMWNFAVRIGDDAPLVDVWQERDPETGPHILWSDLSIPVRFASGITASPPIGPAVTWHEAQITGAIGNDRSSIKAIVLGIDGDTLGSQVLTPPGGTAGIDLGPSGLNIDARSHPFIRLAAVLTDSTRLDTPHLSSWYVAYDPVSEMAVDALSFQTAADSVAEGEPVQVAVNVINGGPSAIDSVYVRYTVTDRNNRSELAVVDTLYNLAADETRESSVSLDTDGRVGTNRVTVVAEQTRGPEPATFNNTAIGNFSVRGDDTPPVFLLTVDGATYPNDPRVINTTDDPTIPFFTSRPTIEISVSDDNAFLPLADTTAISLTLDGARISYARSDVEFVPGTGDNNEARLIFTPDFAGEDTTHTLKAWAQDASGNSEPTKEEPYTLSFRVQTAAEVESLYPYPNPMHNFTTFMFRLRGADASLVDDLRIRVYTISGRPVREFDLVRDPALLEDGGLRIGWNRLNWDGRDEDGDLLATGVYLYKVHLRAEGREMTVNNNSGVEKIAIIR